MTRRRGTVLVPATGLLLSFVVLSPFGPGTRSAGAWSEGPCPTAAGVTVVVDFQELGGGIWVRCTDVAVTTGFEALDRAGIPWTATLRVAGFLCRIDGKPSAAGMAMPDGTTLRDACQTTSPAHAYWSHWMAPRGGGWCYSNLGGGTRLPPEGTVEAWSFSYKRTASNPPTPRYPPPPQVPGAPTALLAGDCDPSTTATTVPPTTPRPTGDGSPTTPGASGAVRPGAAASGLGTGPNSAAPSAPSASGATTTTAPTDPATAATTSPTTDAPDTEVEDGTSGSSGSASGPGGATTASTVVDADGEEVAINGASAERATAVPRSSPAGVVVALAIIGALTGTSVVVRRRVDAAQ